MSEAVGYDFEQLEPSAPPPGDMPARVLAEALAQADSIREGAHEEGYAEGLLEGRRDGSAEVAATARALAEALGGLHELRIEVAEAVERDAVELALALADKILAGALEVRPELVLESVQGALRRLGDRRSVTVLLNPADLPTVAGAMGADAARATGVERFELQAEERVERGSAVVRTDEGEIDASVQTQLERARELVAAELQRSPAG